MKLKVDPEDTPRYFKPRSVPYAMNGKVEEYPVYLDDILVTGANEAEHLSNLEQVLKRLSDAGLRNAANACFWLRV